MDTIPKCCERGAFTSQNEKKSQGQFEFLWADLKRKPKTKRFSSSNPELVRDRKVKRQSRSPHRLEKEDLKAAYEEEESRQSLQTVVGPCIYF
ncbi:hypothetical protein CCR75_004180 [Bremia lactucae]|uniref:Uncharacterized protein n=1 Tax=Bremia lactucae TaxID=4779 RepID=A0A976FM82_BRELC|nr:hypothetical protein CCR75_004180 [Bremia lactucae]